MTHSMDETTADSDSSPSNSAESLRSLARSLADARRLGVAQLTRQAVAFERLLKVSREIAVLDLEGALRAILEGVLELTGSCRSALFLTGPDDPLVFRAGMERGRLALDVEEFPVSRSALERVIESGELLVLDDVLSSDLAGRASTVALQLRSLIAIPLRTHRRSVGVLYLDSDRPADPQHFRDPSILLAIGAQAAVVIDNARIHEDLQRDHFRLRRALEPSMRCGDILYRSALMHRVCRLIEQVAGRHLTVLVRGETGTGKELVAREIHRLSRRCKRPFLSFNVGAVPDALIESELFGHRKGSFTGAVDHQKGLFEAADGGTLFLDEIGEASAAMQVRLLRLLETGSYRRLGETQLRHADLRLIAATHRDLESEVRAGRFRADLYYRLNVFPLRIPPLRERLEDLEILVEHFVDRSNRSLGTAIKNIPAATLEALRRGSWPGNVRQLDNTVQRWMVQAPGDILLVPAEEPVEVGPSAICEQVAIDPPAKDCATLAMPAAGESREILPLAEVERRYLRAALVATNGNQSEAARRLGLKRGTLRHRLSKLGLATPPVR